MKKIHNFLIAFLFFISAQAQNQPIITPLSGGFTFPNQLVEEHTVAFRANTISCGMNFTRYYKYYSFQANFDMVFAFDLIANKPDFRFLVWKLPAGSNPQDIFSNNTTILPSRSVEGEALIKGLKEDDTQICEGYTTSGRNGYAKGFQGSEQLLRGETIVIAVYGNNTTDAFDIKINVAEERTLNIFNNRCDTDGYSSDEILAEVASNSGSTNVTLFQDQNFQNILPAGTRITSAQTIYAQVKDATGKLLYIYIIPLSFKEKYTFQFNPVHYQTCGNTFVVDYDDLIRRAIVNYGNVSRFQIDYVEVEGSRYEDGQNVFFGANHQDAVAQVTYIGSDLCENTALFNFTIDNVKFSPITLPKITTCEDIYTINKDALKSYIQVTTGYNVKFYRADGSEILDGQNLNLASTITNLYYEVTQLETNCVSDRAYIEIEKTAQLPILDVNLTTCLVDLNQALVDQKINEIKNGTTANLTYYFQGRQIQYNELLSIIRTNLNGTIEVRVEEGCPTTRQFTFAINESSVVVIANTIFKQEFCVETGTTINYSNEDLKQIALQNISNPSSILNYNYNFFDESNTEISSINNLQSNRRIRVVVNLRTEDCVIEFYIELKRVNKLIINNPAREITASCDDTIIITQDLLIELFGSDVVNYQTNITLNQPYHIAFGTSNQVTFSIDFYEDPNCVTTKEIIINKGDDLNVDFTLIQQQIIANPYRFCGTINLTELEIYLDGYINQILASYPNLQTEQTVSQYAQAMISNDGVVSVKFFDPNQCGTKEIEFKYSAYPMLDLDIEQNVFTCTGQLYVLNLSDYLIARVYDQNGNEVFGVRNQFSLNVGNYMVEVENEYGCITQKTIIVSTSPEPIIEEIILNLDSIEVLAQGHGGRLEYSLDGINWQSSNKFNGIQKGVSYTVYVRENGCAVISIPDVVYLNLPNFISPNGDGINDIWRPIGVNTSLDVRIQIFNRYGKIVYEAEGANALNWNGTINNRPLPSDSYWYFIEYIDKKTVIKLKYQGYITIKSNK